MEWSPLISVGSASGVSVWGTTRVWSDLSCQSNVILKLCFRLLQVWNWSQQKITSSISESLHLSEFGIFLSIHICSGLADVSAEVFSVHLSAFLFLKRLSIVMWKQWCLKACQRPKFTDFKVQTLRCFSHLLGSICYFFFLVLVENKTFCDLRRKQKQYYLTSRSYVQAKLMIKHTVWAAFAGNGCDAGNTEISVCQSTFSTCSTWHCCPFELHVSLA